MTKISRNAPCPCGSGKKYKHCCLDGTGVDKDMFREGPIVPGRINLMRFVDDLKNSPDLLREFSGKVKDLNPRRDFGTFIRELWDSDKVRKMSTKEIVGKLKSMNVDFETERFKKQVHRQLSAVRTAEKYYYTQNYTLENGYDEDFIWLAICELWKRLFPERINVEMIDDSMQEGYAHLEKKNQIECVQRWGDAWDMIKEIVPPKIKSIEKADKFMPEPLTQSLFNWCQGFALELYNAGISDKSYFWKSIEYCREFYERFPDTKLVILKNMFQTEAESYAMLGEVDTAEQLYGDMIEKFHYSTAGYIGLGDMYSQPERFNLIAPDYDKAEGFYRLGLARCDEDALDLIYGRLEELEEKRK